MAEGCACERIQGLIDFVMFINFSFAQVNAMGVKRKLKSQVVQAQRRKARNLVTRAAQMR
jgi:hypothetical protein